MTSYGLSIILCILYLNSDESLVILNDLTSFQISAQMLLVALIATTSTALITGMIALRTLAWSLIIKEVLYVAVLVILFHSSSLIWSFAIYFVLWHSIPSMHHQMEHLYGEATTKSLWLYIKGSFLYWMAALLFLGMLYYVLQEDQRLFLTILVAFLGGITFPHLIVMNSIHK